MRDQGRGLILFCAIIASLLLAVSCGEKRSTQSGVAPGAALPVARTLPPLPTRPLSPAMQALRARAMRNASDLRELQFLGDVGMAELSPWEYGARASEMAQILGGDELRALGKLAAAGDMLPEGTDPTTLAGSFMALSAGAVYSPLDKQVLVVGKLADDPLVAHEFTHALQDQHFDLTKMLIRQPYDFDRTEAAFAVVEGDAMNVQRRLEQGDAYSRLSLDGITRQETERFSDYRKDIGQLFAPLLIETFIFRYRDGARLIETVRRSGGERGVDQLFNRPPITSEQVLHPEKYKEGEAPIAVSLDENAFASAGWKLVTSTPLGEIGVRGVLMAAISDKDAHRAASGWGGDRAWLFERAGSVPIFVWKTVWDTGADAQEFFNGYLALGRRQGGSSYTGGTQQVRWTHNGRTTVVERSGERVTIIRAADADVAPALGLAQR
ncbi:MAG: hypothetical protein QOJ64_324 [Acidobacteriota bacterium]|nr:hypothetical protein [Acidobacteriota bacterium]